MARWISIRTACRALVRRAAGTGRTASAAALFQALVALSAVPALAQAPRFEITVPAALRAGAVTGRLILLLATSAQPEPRAAISPQGPAIFGVDIERLAAGQPAIVDERALGYPTSLDELPAGEYVAQALINVYERVTRSDGLTLWLPMTDGMISSFASKPGNLYSTPQPVRVGEGATVRIEVSQVVPAARGPTDSPWLKHVRIQSQKLTEFWGRPIFINATALLPKGYADRTDVRYPTIYALGHSIPFGFNPDSTRFRNIDEIDPVTGLETGFAFYRSWTSDSFPRVIAVTFQQSTPYFPDSYSVNSANNGPYGDAIVEEVIPFLEHEFRMIGKPYARILEGASTSGWQTLALILRNPDFFGGAWVLQPDPIEFRRYLLTDIYQDENAFTVRRGQLTVERPFRRTVEGQTVWTMRQLSRFEAVLGSRGRSGYQLGAWEAVYGPVDSDGYPKPLWDKLTGVIDRSVAHWTWAELVRQMARQMRDRVPAGENPHWYR